MILKVIKKLFKAIAILLASVLVLAACMLAFFWITEFKPGDTGATAVLEIENEAQNSIKAGDSIKFEELHAVQTDFVYSDHNPVIATFTLK